MLQQDQDVRQDAVPGQPVRARSDRVVGVSFHNSNASTGWLHAADPALITTGGQSDLAKNPTRLYQKGYRAGVLWYTLAL